MCSIILKKMLKFSSSTQKKGRSPRAGNGNTFQYSCLENLMDRGAWWTAVYSVRRVRHNWVTEHAHTHTHTHTRTHTQERLNKWGNTIFLDGNSYLIKMLILMLFKNQKFIRINM